MSGGGKLPFYIFIGDVEEVVKELGNWDYRVVLEDGDTWTLLQGKVDGEEVLVWLVGGGLDNLQKQFMICPGARVCIFVNYHFKMAELEESLNRNWLIAETRHGGGRVTVVAYNFHPNVEKNRKKVLAWCRKMGCDYLQPDNKPEQLVGLKAICSTGV